MLPSNYQKSPSHMIYALFGFDDQYYRHLTVLFVSSNDIITLRWSIHSAQHRCGHLHIRLFLHLCTLLTSNHKMFALFFLHSSTMKMKTDTNWYEKSKSHRNENKEINWQCLSSNNIETVWKDKRWIYLSLKFWLKKSKGNFILNLKLF